jgi:transposase
MMEHSTHAAGIDIGKTWLDLALNGRPDGRRLPNTAEGHAELVTALLRLGIARIGLEASGGYEREVVAALRRAGFEVIVFQPRQVRAYATCRLRRAKTDRIDAGLIAACAAAHGPARAVPDERLVALAEPLRLVEQIDADVARLKTRREAYADEAIRSRITDEVKRLKTWRAAEIRSLLKALRAHPDLARRLDLLLSIPGLGERTALTLMVRMPELGSLTREEAASLAGLAPFDHASGQKEGRRRIAGGRAVVRTALYAAALPAAHRWNTALIALYTRLKTAGKSHQQALVACARKLLTFANTVLERGTPWQTA